MKFLSSCDFAVKQEFFLFELGYDCFFLPCLNRDSIQVNSGAHVASISHEGIWRMSIFDCFSVIKRGLASGLRNLVNGEIGQCPKSRDGYHL